ncbi:ABC transporter substrate-binding protein [Lutimaribacter marinistellae]|uniref:ABC transporter substrate-binding protein n=1 Tax=Lutimaribacter marinistellae TaxID=1820329 RepID=A0ABV7TE29_9RHOB
MNRIDRRALFTSGAAAALLAATGVSLDAAPKQGGTLRIAVPRDDSLETLVSGAVYDTLTEIGPDGALRGELLRDWQSDAEARNWRLSLRDDVSFHDGHPLSANDVTATLERLGRINLVDTYTVTLTLDDPDPGLPLRLAGRQFAVARAGEATRPLGLANGTGCYRVERAEDGRHFRGTRVADHYKQGKAGWVDVVEIIVIPDAAIRAEALRDGYVDLAALPDRVGLRDRARFRFHPSENDMALAANERVGLPNRIAHAPLDDGRLIERWWMI